MPFKSLRVGVKPGTAKCVYKAVDGDALVQIRSAPLPGQHQASNGYNFTVGGSELKKDPSGGLFCFDSQFTTPVEPGDEIWVGAPEKSPWTEGDVPLTVLVRSGKKET